MQRLYVASKSQTQGRPGYSVTFRHPLRKDSQGKPGLKIRRGLSTSDPAAADALIIEMNTLLSDPSWWNAIKRTEAEKVFSAPIVAAFFDDIQAGRVSPRIIRDGHIPLPGREDGYARVLFVGTTGAGKTTLLRHLIGSDHDRDRFPSTSTAKTTVSDIEIIQANGDYAGIVTFMSEHIAQANVEECVANACVAVFEGKKDEVIAERLLNHRDQRFRLAYTLGSYGTDDFDDDDFSFDTDDEDDIVDDDEEDVVAFDERAKNQTRLRDYVARIRDFSKSIMTSMSTDLNIDIGRMSGADFDAAQELFEAAVWESEELSGITHDILDDIRSRFDLLPTGQLELLRSGWPEKWTFKTDDRAAFIRSVRWFASNYAPQFGRLLTPLVDGMRVRGPLYPDFTEDQPKFVLLDGQGLGHTPESSSSVTTAITARFPEADVILLVDNAQQPMQAAPLSVLRSLATSGHQQKLAIAFTHFDNVEGSNLPTFGAKRAHVMASVTNGLANLRDALGGASVVRVMEQNIEGRCFMMGGLDRKGKDLPKGFRRELEKLVGHIRRSIEPPPQPVAYPEYNMDGVPLAVLAATQGFERPWLGRLGLAGHHNVPKEHWTRIKALNRRIAGEMGTEYDSLRPVADLVARLTEEISRFLDKPARWEPVQPNEVEAEAALDLIRQAVHSHFHSLAMERLIVDSLEDWRRAFTQAGQGSTYRRAQQIRGILEAAAPVPDAVLNEPAVQFLDRVRRIVIDSVAEQRESQDRGASL